MVELLVVIAVIGILIALLLPAVQAAREAARRSQCINHLHQLVLAMHSFEGSQRHLPPGYISATHATPTPADRDAETWDAPPGWGWGAHLLPYLEESAIHDQIDFDLPLWNDLHADLIRSTIPGFLCPSATGPRESFLVESEAAVNGQPGEPVVIGGETVELGRSNYVVSHGQESCWGDCGSNATQDIFVDIYANGGQGEIASVEHRGVAARIADGPFYRNSATRFSQITDGTSKTIFLGEHSSALSDKTWVGVVPGAFSNPRFTSVENGPDTAATLVMVHAGPSGGERDIANNPIIHPINFPTFHVGQMYAEHPGGGNVGLGDGSVRFVTDDVNLLLWAEFSSQDEGETSEDTL